MKIGIITTSLSFLNNYGAALQGYALSAFLKKQNHDCEIINYLGENDSSGDKRRLKDVVKHIFNGEIPILQKLLLFLNRPKREENKAIFVKFRQDYLPMHNKEPYDYKWLTEHHLDFEAYVCGSDQIWNPTIRGNQNDKGYFLKFVPDGKKKIAYAPSIAVTELPEAAKIDFADMVKNFDALSVREVAGAKIIKEQTGLDAEVMPDPTFLLDKSEWGKFMRIPENLPKEYILCYHFGNNKTQLEFIRKLSKKYDLPVFTLPVSAASFTDGFIKRYDIGPREFLGIIHNAKLVCTDSYHAVIFSIFFHRPFLAFEREKNKTKKDMSSRMDTLLEKVELRRNVFDEEIEISDALFETDYTIADKRIIDLRKKGQDFLKQVL